MSTYWVIELRPFSGGEHRFVYSTEAAAKAALHRYKKLASAQALKAGGDAAVQETATSVKFSWESSPVGIIRRSAQMLERGFDDRGGAS